MKNIIVITPVPTVIHTMVEHSIIRKSIKNNVAKIHVFDLRNYGLGNYKQIDDTPFGGGSGMILMAEPLINALKDAFTIIEDSEGTKVILPSPQGVVWKQREAEKLSKCKNLIFICGHYKGLDERFIQKYITDEFSIGDFVVTSGEIPAMLIIDSILRLVPGTLNNIESAMTDSFPMDLLDHPHYTHPRIIEEMKVPDVLISGNHKKIDEWRYDQRIIRTKKNRYDLWEKYKNNKNSIGELNNE